MSVALLPLCVLGCEGGEPSETTAEELQGGDAVVARLTTPQGSVVEIFEALPGTFLVAERGRSPVRPVVDRAMAAMNPLELWQRLAGGAKPPAALIAAVARADMRPARPLAGGPETTAGVADRAASPGAAATTRAPVQALAFDNDELCPGDAFETDFSGCDVNNPHDFRACLRWQHAGTRIQHDNVNFVKTTACVYRGQIHRTYSYKRWFSWTRAYDVTLNAGDWHVVTHGWNSFDIVYRSDVDLVDSSEGYHHSAWGSR